MRRAFKYLQILSNYRLGWDNRDTTDTGRPTAGASVAPGTVDVSKYGLRLRCVWDLARAEIFTRGGALQPTGTRPYDLPARRCVDVVNGGVDATRVA